jgi:hypothetical protein
VEEYEMKNNKVICFFALLAVPFITAAGLARGQNTAQNGGRQAQSAQSEDKLAEYQYAVENFYISRINDIRFRTQARLQLLEVAETQKSEWINIYDWVDFVETVLRINASENQPYSLFEIPSNTPAERLAIAMSRIAQRKSNIMAQSEWEILNLERQKRQALSQASADFQNISGADEVDEMPFATHGVVTGILYAQENSSILIDGRIVHEGQTIYGVKLLTIRPKAVDFEKDGAVWTQKVREAREADWK